jgi:hypothetical protein
LRRERPGHTPSADGAGQRGIRAPVGSAARTGQADPPSPSRRVTYARSWWIARRHRSAKQGAGVDDAARDRVAAERERAGAAVEEDAITGVAGQVVDGADIGRAGEMKFFGGLEMEEIATVLSASVKTVERDVRLGTAWLRSTLSAPPRS